MTQQVHSPKAMSEGVIKNQSELAHHAQVTTA
jgi:hypothetical protein